MTTPETGDLAQSAQYDPFSCSKTSEHPSKRSSRFHFKAEHAKEPARGSRSLSPDTTSHRRHHHHRRRHYHGRHRRKHSRTPSPPPDTDTAFRLSLFDALGDDEGAAFWEGVYGQPIHTYSDQKVGPDGELERMTDEEYTAYVRRRMWEKSTEGIEQERKARAEERREREQRKREQERYDHEPPRRRNKGDPQAERDVFDFEIEASLKRGEKRKRDKAWRQLWDNYLQTWTNLNTSLENLKSTDPSTPFTSTDPKPLRPLLPWPTESTHQRDITPEEVSRFFRKAISASITTSDPNNPNQTENDPHLALITALKTERVRWHPDKIQHRYSRLGPVDQKTLESVTAVFQIVDEMWNEERKRGMSKS